MLFVILLSLTCRRGVGTYRVKPGYNLPPLNALSVTLPTSRSIKLVIDGTIDFGSNWKLEVTPIRTFDRKDLSYSDKMKDYERSLDVVNVDEGNKEALEPGEDSKEATEPDEDNKEATEPHKEYKEATQPDKENKEVVTEYDDDDKKNSKNVLVARTELDKDKMESNETTTENIFVTKLYKGDSKVTKLYKEYSELMLKQSRKIQDDAELIDFVDNVHKKSLRMFSNLLKNTENDNVLLKIKELNERFADKFGKFLNETKNYYLRTTFGTEKLIRNTIDYSDKLLNRLANRFKIDAEDINNKINTEHVKIFKDAVDKLRTDNYNDACNRFRICRVGKEFSDYTNSLLTILLKGDDDQIRLAVEAITKEFKRRDFSKIMDKTTQKVFKDKLTAMQEVGDFERRVLLIGYRIIIETRHEPLFNKYPNDRWVKPTVAMYEIIERFDRNIDMGASNDAWENIRRKLEEWVSKNVGNITDVSKDFSNIFLKEIAIFNDSTANDLKRKMKMFILAKALRVNLDSYLPFQQIDL